MTSVNKLAYALIGLALISGACKPQVQNNSEAKFVEGKDAQGNNKAFGILPLVDRAGLSKDSSGKLIASNPGQSVFFGVVQCKDMTAADGKGSVSAGNIFSTLDEVGSQKSLVLSGKEIYLFDDKENLKGSGCTLVSERLSPSQVDKFMLSGISTVNKIDQGEPDFSAYSSGQNAFLAFRGPYQQGQKNVIQLGASIATLKKLGMMSGDEGDALLAARILRADLLFNPCYAGEDAKKSLSTELKISDAQASKLNALKTKNYRCSADGHYYYLGNIDSYEKSLQTIAGFGLEGGLADALIRPSNAISGALSNPVDAGTPTNVEQPQAKDQYFWATKKDDQGQTCYLLCTGQVNFATIKDPVTKQPVLDAQGKEQKEIAGGYGTAIQPYYTNSSWWDTMVGNQNRPITSPLVPGDQAVFKPASDPLTGSLRKQLWLAPAIPADKVAFANPK